MRITQEQLDAERENTRLRNAGEWFPTRWWRLLAADGRLLAESSDEEEIRRFAARDGGNVRVQHLFEKHESRWEDA